MATGGSERLSESMVVRTHVTPWGFLVALPLALVFAALGATMFELQIQASGLEAVVQTPGWLVGLLLVGFALGLFLVGIAELATYLKPSIEVVVDAQGVTTYGVLGARRLAWGAISRLDVDAGQLTLLARGRTRGSKRHLRLHFSRLAVEPALLVARIGEYRPDL